jgi:hypothetical protein
LAEEADMLTATPEEIERVTEYMKWQAPDLTVRKPSDETD